jgi:hypothetical protein
MAITHNMIMKDSSGKIGDVVFRRRNGKTFICRRPNTSRAKRSSPAQQSVVSRFKAAVLFARTILKNPVIRKLYKAKAKPGQSAYNRAVADYFTAPTIVEINTGQYTGLPGSQIRIWAEDDFKVASVLVSIISSGGKLIETGEAYLDAHGCYWIYLAVQQNKTLAGTTVTVTACDLPGNITTRQSSPL